MTGRFTAAVRRAAMLFDAIATVALVGLVAVVAGSIAGRALFDLSGGAVNLLVPGAIELSGLLLLVVVVAALPGAALRGLTRVDVLLDALPRRLASVLEGLWAAVLSVLSVALAWLLAARAWREVTGGHVSQDLVLPLWPFTIFAALAAVLLALAALSRLIAAAGPR